MNHELHDGDSGGTPDRFNEYTPVFDFEKGVAVGNLTEVGDGIKEESLFSRELFKEPKIIFASE